MCSLALNWCLPASPDDELRVGSHCTADDRYDNISRCDVFLERRFHDLTRICASDQKWNRDGEGSLNFTPAAASLFRNPDYDLIYTCIEITK